MPVHMYMCAMVNHQRIHWTDANFSVSLSSSLSLERVYLLKCKRLCCWNWFSKIIENYFLISIERCQMQMCVHLNRKTSWTTITVESMCFSSLDGVVHIDICYFDTFWHFLSHSKRHISMPNEWNEKRETKGKAKKKRKKFVQEIGQWQLHIFGVRQS